MHIDQATTFLPINRLNQMLLQKLFAIYFHKLFPELPGSTISNMKFAYCSNASFLLHLQFLVLRIDKISVITMAVLNIKINEKEVFT